MNLMSEYIEQLRSLAASLIGGSPYFNERQRIFTQLIAGDDTANLICDSVTRNKIDLAKDLQCQKPMNAENIKVAKKLYYSNNSYLPDCDTGFIKRCKAILSAGGSVDIEMPKELQELILS